ncbi:MAG: hypothetical protein WKF73_09025 [Nocardioidaceae bacterium]
MASNTRSRRSIANRIRADIRSSASSVRSGSIVSTPSVNAWSGETPTLAAISARMAAGVHSSPYSSPKV